MTKPEHPLPQWTWEDLEAALDGFSPSGRDRPVHTYLMQGLAEDARRLPPRELLKQVLSAGWVMAQMGARNDGSDTARPRVTPEYAS